MSLLNPTKSTLKSALLQHSAMLVAKAERLKAFAESLDESSEETFMEYLGNEHSGPGFVRNIEEEVAKASEVRPSDLFQIRHTLTSLFTKAQRQSATEAAEERFEAQREQEASA